MVEEHVLCVLGLVRIKSELEFFVCHSVSFVVV
jgi:hypothetical protein